MEEVILTTKRQSVIVDANHVLMDCIKADFTVALRMFSFQLKPIKIRDNIIYAN